MNTVSRLVLIAVAASAGLASLLLAPRGASADEGVLGGVVQATVAIADNGGQSISPGVGSVLDSTALTESEPSPQPPAHPEPIAPVPDEALPVEGGTAVLSDLSLTDIPAPEPTLPSNPVTSTVQAVESLPVFDDASLTDLLEEQPVVSGVTETADRLIEHLVPGGADGVVDSTVAPLVAAVLPPSPSPAPPAGDPEPAAPGPQPSVLLTSGQPFATEALTDAGRPPPGALSSHLALPALPQGPPEDPLALASPAATWRPATTPGWNTAASEAAREPYGSTGPPEWLSGAAALVAATADQLQGRAGSQLPHAYLSVVAIGALLLACWRLSLVTRASPEQPLFLLVEPPR